MAVHPNELTPFDPNIMKLLIHNKMYSFIIDYYETLPSIFHESSGINCLDSMIFLYYYGYACTALKMYKRAYDVFRMVLVHPTSIIHKCMLNAYKKYIIVALLINKSPNFPKKCNENMIAFLPKKAENYKRLIESMAIVL